jgi:hypothetical protein
MGRKLNCFLSVFYLFYNNKLNKVGDLMAKYPFLRKKENQYIFDGYKIRIFIPKEYFEKEVAVEKGKFIETTGIFVFREYKNEKDKRGNKHTMKLPYKMQFNFSNTYDAELSLARNKSPEKYKVYELEKGDLFMKNNQLADSSINEFVDVLHKGRIPNSTDYSEIIKIYLKLLEFSGTSLGVPSLVLETIVSVLARNKEDLTQQFRQVIGNDEAGENDYELVNIKQVPSLESTFSDITFEDMNQSLINSVKRSRNNEEEKESSIEKVMKY